MREIEIRRHSCTKKGLSGGSGSQLSTDGVRLARETGAGLGPFDLVLTSEVPRTLETALAMGFAVDRQIVVPRDLSEGAMAIFGHHERWSWPEPWARFAGLVSDGGAAATFGRWLRTAWVEALESVPDGGRVLVVSHGRDIEAGVVACLDDLKPADFSDWGDSFHQCEGVRLTYDQGACGDPRILRTRRCNGHGVPESQDRLATNAAYRSGDATGRPGAHRTGHWTPIPKLARESSPAPARNRP